MKEFLFLIYIVVAAVPMAAQEESLYFSEAISQHLHAYQQKADNAYKIQNLERADFLFDSLVQNCLKGSTLDNFRVNNLRKKDVYLEDFEKPVFLRTYASWLAPSEGEIPALNQMAKEYAGEIKIVLLFWDDHKTTRKLARNYEKNISILYVDELDNNNPEVIRLLKHSLGIPTTYLLDKDKQIIDIKRSLAHPYGIGFEKSLALHYDAISEGMDLLLLDRETEVDRVAEIKL